MIRPLALAALLAGFASSLLADNPAQTRRTTPITDWSQPTEAGVAWDSGTYAYDGSGNIVRIGLDAFGYDGAGRLTSGTVNAYGVATTQTFQYDRFGNILQVKTTPDYGGDFPVPPETAELEVNSGTNRLSRACHPIHGCETWTYDGATGNVLSSQKSGGTTVFSVAYGWDPDGAMTELEGGSAHERYIYDANGERIITVSLDGNNEVIRRWTWRDASNKVAREAVEQVGVGVWSEARDNVYRDGTLLAAYTSANAAVADRHYHVDHLGTPRLITDAARHKVAIEAYLPFGDRAPGSELPYVGFKDRMRFTGHERDGEGSPYRPSLDYMHARYYTPEWGRFLSVDPTWESADLRKPQSWNRYSYVLNNPINYTDPDGRCPLVLDCVALAALGKAVFVVGTTLVVGAISETEVNGKPIGTHVSEFILRGGGSSGEMAAETMVNNFQRQQAAKLDQSAIQSSERNPKQDKILTNGDIDKLQNAGHDVHELKGGDNASKYDLYKDKQGNVYVKPKGGKGPGEETGINLNDVDDDHA